MSFSQWLEVKHSLSVAGVWFTSPIRRMMEME